MFEQQSANLSSATITATAPESGRAEFLYLDQSAVLAADILNMPRAMNVIAEALKLFELGKCRQPNKVVLRDGDAASEEHGRFNGLFAAMAGPRPVAGMKWLASFPSNRNTGLPRASGLIILNSVDNGLPVAVMDGTLINAMRTGAVTALGASYLAPRQSRKVAVIGAGVQARTQILGLITALPALEQIAVVNRSVENAEVLAAECQTRWHAPVVPVGTIADAVTDADVVLTITTAQTPLLGPEHVKPGALTIQLAGNECEFELIKRCHKIVTDDWEVIKHRGIITPAVMHAQGLLADEDIYSSLGELLLGRKAGRESDSERIHFAHMGMGVNDVALACEIHRTACRIGIGRRLTLWEQPLWT